MVIIKQILTRKKGKLPKHCDIKPPLGLKNIQNYFWWIYNVGFSSIPECQSISPQMFSDIVPGTFQRIALLHKYHKSDCVLEFSSEFLWWQIWILKVCYVIHKVISISEDFSYRTNVFIRKSSIGTSMLRSSGRRSGVVVRMVDCW